MGDTHFTRDLGMGIPKTRGHSNHCDTAALGDFLVGCVELGMSGFSKWRAVKVSTSNSPKNQGETGIFAEDKAEIKDKGQ